MKSARKVLAGAAALTGTLDPVGVALDAANFGRVSLELVWVKGGSATLLELVVEGDLGAGVWVPLEEIYDAGATVTAGVATAASGYLKRTYDTAGSYGLTVDTGAFRRVRVKARETGTPGGTLTIAAAGAIV